MSIIEINGENPFRGQSEPYLSLQSSIDQEGLNVTNTYSLNGVLTGCSYEELETSRDALVTSFDWKESDLITGRLNISGVTTGEINAGGVWESSNPIFPRSISFSSSNYLGSVQYTIDLDEINSYNNNEGDGIVDKVHTETTSTTEDGCVSVSLELSCSPDANMQECWGLESGSNWISGRLNQPDVGYLSRESQMPLKTEALTIDPTTLAVSYSSSYGTDCDEGSSNVAGGGAPSKDYDFTHCKESAVGNENCSAETSLATVTHKGELYSSGKNESELLEKLDDEILDTYDGAINEYNITYNNATDTVNYEFKVLENASGTTQYTPVDLTYNNQTITKTEDHLRNQTTTTVAGNVSLIGPDEKGPAAINNHPEDTVKSEAKSEAGPDENLTSEEFTRDTTAGTINYSYSFSSEADPNSNVSLDGFSGVSQYSVDVSLPVQEYETVPVLDCDDLIFEGPGTSLASATISITSVPGPGYDMEEWNGKCRDHLLNTFIPTRQGQNTTADTSTTANYGLQTKYSFTFTASSVTTKNDPDKIERMKTSSLNNQPGQWPVV